MTTKRGTSNSNSRGNSRDRARRRAWLLAQFGNGWVAPCYRCGTLLDDSTITVDRIVPGVEGGKYEKSNIRPACGDCNSSTGGALGAARKASRSAAEEISEALHLFTGPGGLGHEVHSGHASDCERCADLLGTPFEPEYAFTADGERVRLTMEGSVPA